ncbi:FkbM family methyltransferase [Sciscionella sediminilitoris]|uniref:FkbM family methyltransferase n=1 Tax=Sciscionella sediminilitoris TaxID=1445613 RepID=UPI0004DF2F49|nr:FkbM family methyltransferase [Sciscionella sp. SE31]
MTANLTALHCVNSWEAAYLRDEVNGYFANGIELAPGATVLDVGANIGVFSAAVHERSAGEARIYAFEPLPPLHAILERNAREFFGGRVTTLPYGLSASEAELEFSYFPAATIFSSSFRDKGNVDAERRRIAASIAEMMRREENGSAVSRMPAPILRALVGRQLRSMRQLETHRVRVRPLSRVLEEHHIEHIDLLKVDVEGAELEVLHGIEDRHWPLIRQAVVEVEGWRRNGAVIAELLGEHGFSISTEQGPVQRAADVGMVFAIR